MRAVLVDGQGQSLCREQAYFQAQVGPPGWNFLLGLAADCRASISFRLEDPATGAGEHSLIEHHTFIQFLPVQGYHLGAHPPVESWVDVRAVDSRALREHSHEKRF